jgi:hypothetical protein
VLRFGICFVAVALATGSAAAQEIHPDCQEDVESDEMAQAEAGKWFAKGEELVTKNKPDKAIGAFLCAYALAPHPAPVFNAAQAALSGGKTKIAITYFKQYLSMAPTGPLAEQARKELEKLEGPAAEPAQEAPPPIVAVDTGPPAPVHDDYETPWEVPEPEVEAEDEGTGPVAITGWVFVGVGAAGLVTGAVLQGLAGKAVTDGEAMNEYLVFKDQQDKVDGLQKGALIGFIAGGALVAAGIVMIAVGDDDEESPAAEISLSPTPGGLSIGGTF